MTEYPRQQESDGYNGGYMRDLGLPKRRYRKTKRRHWTGRQTISAAQVRQGDTEVCYILAAAVGNLTYRAQLNTKTGRIRRYEFKFKDEHGIVNKVRLPAGGRVSNLIAEAYARTRPHQDVWNSGYEWNALADITGRRTVAVLPDQADELLSRADAGETLASLGSSDLLNPFGWVRNHAYAIHEVTPLTLTVYNPWGKDGVGQPRDSANDGFVTFSKGELQQALDSGVRLRLGDTK